MLVYGLKTCGKTTKCVSAKRRKPVSVKTTSCKNLRQVVTSCCLKIYINEAAPPQPKTLLKCFLTFLISCDKLRGLGEKRFRFDERSSGVYRGLKTLSEWKG